MIVMIYDPETDRYYLSDSHLKNSKLCQEALKKQKPFSREEMRAQYLRLKQKKQETDN